MLLNGCAAGTLRLEEFPGKVKGMQPANSMFCSEQEPGDSIVCSALHMSAISGGEFQLSGSPGAGCCLLLGLNLAAGSKCQPSARNLPGAGSGRGIFGVCCLLGCTCWKAGFHSLPCHLVGSDLSQVSPLSPEPMLVASQGVARRSPEGLS